MKKIEGSERLLGHSFFLIVFTLEPNPCYPKYMGIGYYNNYTNVKKLLLYDLFKPLMGLKGRAFWEW
jgi:hypothetical protein